MADLSHATEPVAPELPAPRQLWLTPDTPLAAGYPAPPRPVLRYDLRPLSTGEILDRTFTLFRSRFWLFAGLSSIAACFRVISTAGYLAFFSTAAGTRASAAGGGAIVSAMIGLGTYSIGAILALVAYSITQAATTSAVSAVYLGHETSVGTALRSVRGHWFRYVLIALWQTWSAVWIFTVLLVPAALLLGLGIQSLAWLSGLLIFLAMASLVYGVIAYLRNSLAVPAAVVEDIRVPAAMRRSKQLSAGGKGRIFLMFLLLAALYMVAGALQTPFSLMLFVSRSGEHVIAQGITLLITFLTTALVGPIGAIALCLFYIDERVRKEAFDIDVLMSRSAPPLPSLENPELA
jgi:hypothetical protein